VHPDCTRNWDDSNIKDDSLFADPNNADYHFGDGSPCSDAGDNASIPPDTADLDGDGNTTEPIPFDLDGLRRIADLVVDMGAYEVQRIMTPGLRRLAGPVRSQDAQPAPPP
jgi:hypothetical protein